MNTRRDLLTGAGILGAATLGWAVWRGVGDEPRRQQYSTTGSSHLPNSLLHTHDGQAVKFYDDLVRDKVVAINMMYASCAGICPTATANLLQVQRLLGARAGRDVFIYSITLEPEIDTPQSLKAYAERHRIQPGWLFLTGTPENVREVRIALGFYDVDPQVDADKSSHSGMLRVGNDARDSWTMAPTQATPKQILATIDHVDRVKRRA